MQELLGAITAQITGLPGFNASVAGVAGQCEALHEGLEEGSDFMLRFQMFVVVTGAAGRQDLMWQCLCCGSAPAGASASAWAGLLREHMERRTAPYVIHWQLSYPAI